MNDIESIAVKECQTDNEIGKKETSRDKFIHFCEYWKNNLPIKTAKYYLCESFLAMPVKSSVIFSTYYNANIERIRQERDNTLTELEGFFKNYIFMSCLGEIRHGILRHNDFEKYLQKGELLDWLPKSFLKRDITFRDRLWQSAYTHTIKGISRDKCQSLCDVFSDNGWHGGFGGEKWSKIACTLSKYLNGIINKAVFVDTAINLVHNNSLFVDKLLGSYTTIYGMILDVKFISKTAIELTDRLYATMHSYEQTHSYSGTNSQELLKYGEFKTWLKDEISI